jgi:RNA polymerase sigma factor for flagellar operon FliA
MRQLAAQDRLILKMRFQDNCQVADIARALQLEAKPLYRHIDKLLVTLRRTLEGEGLTSADLTAAWSNHGFDSIEGGESWGEVRPFDRSGPAPALTGGHRE